MCFLLDFILFKNQMLLFLIISYLRKIASFDAQEFMIYIFNYVRKPLSFDVQFFISFEFFFVFQPCWVRLVHQYRSSTNGVSWISVLAFVFSLVICLSHSATWPPHPWWLHLFFQITPLICIHSSIFKMWHLSNKHAFYRLLTFTGVKRSAPI